MSLLASKTFLPCSGGTSAVKLPAKSTGSTTGMPAACATLMSSSPKAGAIWTTPVPSSSLDEVAAEDAEGVLASSAKIREQRLVGAADQLGALEAADLGRSRRALCVVLARAVAPRIQCSPSSLHQRVVEPRAGPRAPGWTAASTASSSRRGAFGAAGSPARVELEARPSAPGPGAVAVALSSRVSKFDSGVCARPGIGHDAVALVDEALVPQLLNAHMTLSM